MAKPKSSLTTKQRSFSPAKAQERPKYNFDEDVAKFTDRQLEACAALDTGHAKYLLYGGALGGGKSFFLRWVAIRLLMTFFAKYGLRYVQVMLACEDYPSLKDRQLSKVAREFPQWLGKMYTDHKDYGRCYILNDDYGNGVICFRNLDDSSKYQSAEFAAILVDEFTKNDYDTFTFLRMRLRWPGIPDEECVFIGATNPGGIGHNFTKALWMDRIFPDEFIKPIDYREQFKYIPSKADDNPYLDASYYNTLYTLPIHLREAFKEGNWDIFVGQAFQEWSRNYHVIEPLPVPTSRPLYMTFDWGFGAPFSVGWWWIDDDGRKYRFAEWYGWTGTPNKGIRLSDSEIAAGIIKREQAMGFNTWSEYFGKKAINQNIIRLCDPTCFNKKPDYRGGGQGPSTVEVFMENGLILRPGDPSRTLKLRQFHQHLLVPHDDEGKVSGIPMMQIYNTCHQFIRTIPNLITDPNNIEDIETDGEDHIYDEASHIVMARPIGSVQTGMSGETPKKGVPTIEDVAKQDREEAWKEAMGDIAGDWY